MKKVAAAYKIFEKIVPELFFFQERQRKREKRLKLILNIVTRLEILFFSGIVWKAETCTKGDFKNESELK